MRGHPVPTHPGEILLSQFLEPSGLSQVDLAARRGLNRPRNGARAIGMGDRLGSIEAGKLADLLVVRGDPLEDIRATRTVHTVMKGGVPYDARALLDSVRGKLGPANEDAAKEW